MNRSCSTADLLFNLLDVMSHALLQRADKMSKRDLGRKFTYSLVRKVSVTKYIENRE